MRNPHTSLTLGLEERVFSLYGHEFIAVTPVSQVSKYKNQCKPVKLRGELT